MKTSNFRLVTPSSHEAYWLFHVFSGFVPGHYKNRDISREWDLRSSLTRRVIVKLLVKTNRELRLGTLLQKVLVGQNYVCYAIFDEITK